MSLASRHFVHFLRFSPMAGGGVQNAILFGRHRCLSSVSSGSWSPIAADPPPATSAAAAAVVVTDTKAGGGKPAEQGSVKLDACGTIEGEILHDDAVLFLPVRILVYSYHYSSAAATATAYPHDGGNA